MGLAAVPSPSSAAVARPGRAEGAWRMPVWGGRGGGGVRRRSRRGAWEKWFAKLSVLRRGGRLIAPCDAKLWAAYEEPWECSTPLRIVVRSFDESREPFATIACPERVRSGVCAGSASCATLEANLRTCVCTAS